MYAVALADHVAHHSETDRPLGEGDAPCELLAVLCIAEDSYETIVSETAERFAVLADRFR